MIDIRNLSARYGKKEVLSDITMTLETGKIYGLLGENGVGKTTLLKIIGGLQKPFAGSCRVGDQIPFERTPQFLSNIYYLPEDLEYIQIDLTPLQFAKSNGRFYPNFDLQKFEAILHEFSVENNKRLDRISQGQTKKVAIAFALATNAQLLLMDEPSNGLDIPSKTIFRKMVAQYCLDTTCAVISTHQVRDLENLIDPIIILDNRSVLMNESLERIADKLYFSLETTTPQNVLYSEPTIGGYICVSKNKGRGETRINLEALFNATMQHKSHITNIFKNS